MSLAAKSLSLVLALAFAGPLLASDRSDLYTVTSVTLYSVTSVTSGTGEKNRDRALGPSLADVLVKVSGDPSLLDDPRVAAMQEKAGTLVATYDYRDLLNNRPPNHEQGTYDRPQYLTTTFDKAAIDAALKSLGPKPWLSRPQVVAFLSVETMKGETFFVGGGGMAADDGKRSGMAADMRGSLMAAAERAGIPLLLSAETSSPDAAKAGEAVLSGLMAWRAEAKGWVADWTLVSRGRDYRWRDSGVGFDDAFRNAMRGTAQILSGNGRPE